MDLSKLSPNQQLASGAAVALFVVAFLPWYGVTDEIRWTGWNSGFLGLIGIVLIVAAGVILVMESMDRSPVSSPAEIVFYMIGAGAALILLRTVFRLGGAASTRRIGLYLALIVAGVAVWGAYQNWLDNS